MPSTCTQSLSEEYVHLQGINQIQMYIIATYTQKKVQIFVLLQSNGINHVDMT